MAIYSRAVLGICLSLLFLVSGASAESVSKIASRIDRHYNHLHSFHSRFEEIYEGAGISRKEAGELFLEKPGKMRWNYEQPRPKIFLSDGKTAYFYVPGDQQARKMPVKKLADLRSPIRLLLGHTELQKEFRGLTLSSEKPLEPSDLVLQGVPKGMEDRISRVLLEVSPEGQIARIFVEELDGATTDFRFADIQENVSLSPDLFKFTAPPGIQIIETNEVGP